MADTTHRAESAQLRAYRQNLRTRRVPRAAGTPDARHVAPVFHGIGIVEATGTYDFPPHRQRSYEVIVVDRGLYRCRLNDAEFSLRKAEGIVVKPGDVHEDFCRPPLAYFGVSFDLSSDLDGLRGGVQLFAEGAAVAMQRFEIDRRLVSPLVEQIRHEAEHPDAFSAHVQDALLLRFFWHLVRALAPEAISEVFLDLSYRQAFPTQLMRVFRSNISRALSLGEMAGLMGVSESTLSHKCKGVLGISPAKAFMRCKMDRAMQLLENTSMQVKEIAFRLGFDDPYAFTRAFTRYHGHAPSAFRS